MRLGGAGKGRARAAGWRAQEGRHGRTRLFTARPSVAGLLNDVGWYYVQSRWKVSGPRQPKEEDRQVVAITFTEDGVVENIERFGLEKGNIVPISRRVTETSIKGMGILRQLFGNIGRVSADQIIK